MIITPISILLSIYLMFFIHCQIKQKKSPERLFNRIVVKLTLFVFVFATASTTAVVGVSPGDAETSQRRHRRERCKDQQQGTAPADARIGGRRHGVEVKLQQVSYQGLAVAIFQFADKANQVWIYDGRLPNPPVRAVHHGMAVIRSCLVPARSCSDRIESPWARARNPRRSAMSASDAGRCDGIA